MGSMDTFPQVATAGKLRSSRFGPKTYMGSQVTGGLGIYTHPKPLYIAGFSDSWGWANYYIYIYNSLT